jgi:ABC-type transport system involved in multi-copper enzyme maturation permease subunit
MWLITTLIAAIVATILTYITRNKYKLGFLSLMLWGSTIMILVDFIMGYEGGTFIEMKTDGMITSGFLLGIVMLIPVLIVWLTSNLMPRFMPNKSR